MMIFIVQIVFVNSETFLILRYFPSQIKNIQQHQQKIKTKFIKQLSSVLPIDKKTGNKFWRNF